MVVADRLRKLRDYSRLFQVIPSASSVTSTISRKVDLIQGEDQLYLSLP